MCDIDLGMQWGKFC